MAISIFGYELKWEVEDALFWLMVAQVALVLLMLIVFAVLIHRVGRDKTVVVNEGKAAAPERKLLGITLDTTSVQRKFALGDKFNCDGLVAIAQYSDAPVYESITDAVIKSAEQYAAEVTAAEGGAPAAEGETAAPAAEGEAAPVTAGPAGLIVIVPTITGLGKAFVTVLYGGMKAVYAIELGEKEEEAAPVAEPVRTLLSVTLDTSMVQREFRVGEEFNCAGLLVTANYNLEPKSEGVSEFEVDVPDMTAEGKPTVTVRYGGKEAAYVISVAAAEEEEPVAAAEPVAEPVRTLLSVTLDTSMVQREFRVGEEFNFEGLVVTANYNLEPTSEPVTDYTVEQPDMSVEGKPSVVVTYGDKTAVYAISVANPAEEEVAAAETAAPETVSAKGEEPAEESAEGGTLRYDKSFTARLIQADDETKQWYTEIKNGLLGYKKVHDRMSWKRETYRVGRETVARLSFRGKTLCLFLPLYAADLEGSKYKVEDVSDNASCADTPCMYRIKNAKRARYAGELFALVMEKMGVPTIERESVDYYLPYEGIVELIKKGLVKRDIKSKSEEAFFNKGEGAEATETGEVAVAADDSDKK